MITFMPECFVIRDGMSDKEILDGLKKSDSYIDLRKNCYRLPVEKKTMKQNKPKEKFKRVEIGEIKI